jgi:hypothetical protein
MGSCGVRFEGIDTLEAHFENQHQDLTHAAVAARDQMLELMGFGQVEFWADLLNEIKTAQRSTTRSRLPARQRHRKQRPRPGPGLSLGHE